ncbi:MAG: sodium:proton exchanger [Bacteroidia bacterium]|nr:cation:proton antiporter [Bacteroidia bacterium]NNC86352.1 sodium:proton exchanger [Bacteroidia bacterium]NNM15647.1 sodium:proton exchanger [Bacteroidia bacterium]
MSLEPNLILIALSVIIILSYLFNFISNAIKIPSVILLIGTGILLNYAGGYWNFSISVTDTVLQLFGTLGLILIVLEGALDLKITKQKAPLIFKSLLSALVILVVTAAVVTMILNFWLGVEVEKAIVYAIPLAVISSAIAIPSVHKLSENKKEFIIYESTFSDVLGIMFFNYAIGGDIRSSESVMMFFGNFFIIMIISAIASLVLLWLLNHVKTHVKFFLVFAILLLIYGIGKKFHLSSLLLILVFGLMLNNNKLFIKGKLARYLHIDKISAINEELKLITAESAFLIRTFFFILFGYSMNLMVLLDIDVIFIGLLIITTILFIRYIFLRFISHINLFPEIFIAPRGLITIILFLSIPEQFKIDEFSEGILFFVIIASSLIMMFGLMFSKAEFVESTQVETTTIKKSLGDFDSPNSGNGL